MENRELQQCISLEKIKDFEGFESQVIECIAKEKKDPFILLAYKGGKVIEREFSSAGAYFNFEKRDVFCKYSGFVGSVDLFFEGVSIGGSMIYFDQDGRLEFIEAYFWEHNLFFLKLERELALRNHKLRQCISLEKIKDFEGFESQVIECIAKEKKDFSLLSTGKEGRVMDRKITPASAYFIFEKREICYQYLGYSSPVDLYFGGVCVGGSRIYFDQDGRLEFIEAYFWEHNLFFLKLEKSLIVKNEL